MEELGAHKLDHRRADDDRVEDVPRVGDVLVEALVRRAAEEQLDAEVGRLAASIISKPPVAIATGKRMFYEQRSMADLDAAYAYAAGVMARNMLEAETVEGVDAFLEKRPPRWRGPDEVEE